MTIDLRIDGSLVKEALELSSHRTKRGVIEEALREYVIRRKQLQVLELFGTIDYDEEYDYKAQRKRQ